MAFADMRNELRGCVPKIPFAITGTWINRAWKVIRESDLWSFNLYDAAWISPPPINTGLVTCIQGFNTIQFDATAIAAINQAQIDTPYSLITQRQFRPGATNGLAGIYNLIGYDQITGLGTLDRIYADPTGTSTSYNIYQMYYPAPYKDHLAWVSVRNMSYFLDLNCNCERNQIDVWDPQRSLYQYPTYVVPYMLDNRGAGTEFESSTLGFPLFELWGQPVTTFTYMLYGIRRGTDLVQPGDTLPQPVGEDCVLSLARSYAYEWAEANKDMTPRSQGPDFRFLIGKTLAEHKDLKIRDRKNDKEFCNLFFSIHNLGMNRIGAYNTYAGVASPYGGGTGW